MLKRPSSRRNTEGESVALNLVPIIDAMVALIAFMLMTMSFLNIVHIESPFPIASAKDVQERLKEKPLQLTISIREKDTEIWSPFNLISAKTIANVLPGQPDVKAVHDALVEVKQKFPNEVKAVVVPFGGATYDTLIAVMDSNRMIDAGDAPIYHKNPQTGMDEPVKVLFPEIVFGNLLGGD